MFAKKSFVVALTVTLLASLLHQSAAEDRRSKPRYRLVDIGGLGGPGSFLQNGFDGILNSNGELAGWADTATPDPFPNACSNPDCLVSHAFLWQRGHQRDLGALREGFSSQAFWISSNGLVIGNSQNGKLDPLVPGFPEIRAVLWRDGKITNLGTLEGGYESVAGSVNSRGEAVGFSLNTVPDPYSIVGFGFQTRAFLWRNGLLRDLGTLGGPDADALLINEQGDVAGLSYIDSTPNPNNGVPTADPFFWSHGRMYDVGSLGGTFGQPYAFNNRGQMVGVSNLPGDVIYHPFLWDNGVLTDLGTLGGDTGFANWINDKGVIAGKADLPGAAPQNHDAVIWNNAQMVDLGTVPGDACANAYFVNSKGDVVGASESSELCRVPIGEHAFLWKEGGPMVDLNSLIPPNSPLQLTFAVAINDRGMISGFGVPAGCDPANVEVCGHAYVLIPCDADERCDCEYAASNPSTSVSSAPVQGRRPHAEMNLPHLMKRLSGERPR
jgi:probable HAF family extracellular repeat protein